MEKNSQEGVYMRVSQREVKGNDEAMEKFKGIIRKVLTFMISIKFMATLKDLKVNNKYINELIFQLLAT